MMSRASGRSGDTAGTIGDLGEDLLVAGVLARYSPLPGFVRVGPGDDAAVLDLAGPLVAATDTLVEGRDFLRAWSSGHDVGVKTAAQNLADIAAMGGRPLALLVSLAAPGDLPVGFAQDLADGLDDECARAGAAVIGGDVSAADCVVVTGTALGVLDGQPVLRSGARPGDVVALSGRTGPSAAGLALLQAGAADRVVGALAQLVATHRTPRPDYAAGPRAAAAGATAMIDTSDGLLRDAARIAERSGVLLDLDAAALTPPTDLVEAAHLLGEAGADDAVCWSWVLAGGEDHALLACFTEAAAVPSGFRVIGRVTPPERHDLVRVEGRPWRGAQGWRHWD